MSKKGSSPDKDEPAPDLSALDFGPSWARPDQGKKSHSGAKGRSHAGAGSKPSRSSKPARPPKGRQAGSDDRGRHDGKQHRHSGSDRERRGGPSKGRGRNDYSKGGREQRHFVDPPEGVKARIMPIEEGLDAMAKQISATGRTHSVFDLAWLVLGGMERFHVIFESEEEPLYRSESDHSVWRNKQECLAHFFSSGLVEKYYDEEITKVDPPSGNFQSVARCGLSKKLIGPPNHHGYQQALVDLHQERFSNMPIERYKSKIIMEHGEEAVQEWVDAMCQHKRWRPKSEQAADEKQESEEQQQADQKQDHPDVESDVKAEEDAVDAVAPATEEPSSQDDVPAAENEAEQAETPEAETPEAETPEAETPEAEAPEPDEPEAEQPEDSEPAPPAPTSQETVVILDNRRELEQHFLAHGFEKEFYEGKTVSALANIPAKMISPGLMSLLKNTVAEEKRYPGNLASILCRQMSGRHLAVFKWKKRLHCGPARPRHVADDMVMADRPAKMFHWVIDHPGGNIEELWKDCLPADVDEQTRHTWYHDLHWLINEGLALLFSDGTLHAAKELNSKQAEAQAAEGTAKTATKQAGKKQAAKKKVAKKQVAPDKQAEAKDAEAAPQEDGASPSDPAKKQESMDEEK